MTPIYPWPMVGGCVSDSRHRQTRFQFCLMGPRISTCWRRIASPMLLAAGAMLAMQSGADAAVLFDSFNPDGSFNSQAAFGAAAISVGFGPTNGSRAAARFTVTGGDYTLDTITLPLATSQHTGGDLLRVRVVTSVGDAPG